MEFITYFLDFVIHLDKHLAEIIQNYGTLTYLILGLIVFCETGLVVTPFLPGDSLLFVIGALSASGSLDLGTVTAILIGASILGDNVNYQVGKFIGPKIFSKENVRFLNKQHLIKTHEFYEKHGGKTIIIAKFMPIVRTFAPFVAGVGRMTFGKFLLYNVVGGFVWVLIFVLAGYFFGNVPAVKNNFGLVIIGVIFISLLPGIITYLKNRNAK